MITAICRFALNPDHSREQIVAALEQGIPFYQGRAGLVRKYNCIDMDRHEGCGVYLWHDRKLAESYFAEVAPVIREQMGSDPEVTYLDTPIVVDNLTGEVQVAA